VGFEFGGLLLRAEFAIDLFRIAAADDVADFVIAVAGVEDLDFVNDNALLDFAYGSR